MMRRNVGFLLLFALTASGSAPFADERLVCPMPIAPAGSSPACEACAMDSPSAAASLEAASCCTVAPATVAEVVPATVTAQRRGVASNHSDGAPILGALYACPEVPARHVPSFDPPAPSPTASPPPLSTQTTHLRN